MSDLLTIPSARCRIWRDGPAWNGTPAAAIGELAFDTAGAGAALLTLAFEHLRAEGHAAVLAPMNGDTWHAYRAVVESDGSAAFPLEPVSGTDDVAALVAAGFDPVADYVSSRAPVPAAAEPEPAVPGVSVRAWDGTGADALLDRLFALAGGSFADKLFFRAIDRDAFLALYRPLLAAVDPRLVLFAFDATGDLAGFLFGLPDPVSGTAILKTYAGLRPGVGHLLAHRFHQEARRMGFAHVVHALMHVDNVSLRRSAQHQGVVFRRYSLFGRRL
ncbi:hypothetical protein ASE95_15600 [Sphingomonas sp. Leaf231]|uniref:hypothetical protein n=1 Tax=Sphingomonas sp. Leaf231 TaxID=1736301 RepID=UPI0006F97C15|nr:hypothetical protein [Sphingomonas sp. Leaf231]KQN90119.1 hypothetical protein ASE95_15600 [Sphingomonas sp. Leaf231]